MAMNPETHQRTAVVLRKDEMAAAQEAARTARVSFSFLVRAGLRLALARLAKQQPLPQD